MDYYHKYGNEGEEEACVVCYSSIPVINNNKRKMKGDKGGGGGGCPSSSSCSSTSFFFLDKLLSPVIPHLPRKEQLLQMNGDPSSWFHFCFPCSLWIGEGRKIMREGGDKEKEKKLMEIRDHVLSTMRRSWCPMKEDGGVGELIRNVVIEQIIKEEVMAMMHHRQEEELMVLTSSPSSCSVCGKEFLDRRKLVTHEALACKVNHDEELYTKLGIKWLRCSAEGCGYKTNQRTNMKTHYRARHTSERPFICGECGEAFAHKHVMKYHIKKHHCSEMGVGVGVANSNEGDKKGVMVKPECSKKSKKEKENQPPSTPSPPPLPPSIYPCRVCGTVFKTKRCLVIHEVLVCKVEHGEGIYKSLRINWTRCGHDGCGYKSFKKTFVDTHFRARHKKEKPFPCRWCGKGFAYKQYLGKHERMVHSRNEPQKSMKNSEDKENIQFPAPSFICSKCGKEMSSKKDWVLHEAVVCGVEHDPELYKEMKITKVLSGDKMGGGSTRVLFIKQI